MQFTKKSRHRRTETNTVHKSNGYLDIKNCSTYKNSDTHLKKPVLIRQIYLKTICIKVWKFHPGTHDSQTISFRPRVDSQFSHESDMATEYFKMPEFTQEHSPLFIFQVENLFCTLLACLKIKECINVFPFPWIVAPAWFLLSVYLLEIARLICEQNLEHTEFKNTSLV